MMMLHCDLWHLRSDTAAAAAVDAGGRHPALSDVIEGICIMGRWWLATVSQRRGAGSCLQHHHTARFFASCTMGMVVVVHLLDLLQLWMAWGG